MTRKTEKDRSDEQDLLKFRLKMHLLTNKKIPISIKDFILIINSFDIRVKAKLDSLSTENARFRNTFILNEITTSANRLIAQEASKFVIQFDFF